MKLCSKLITLSRTSRRTLAGLQKRPIFLSAVSLNVCLAASARLPEVTDEDSFANLRSQISGLARPVPQNFGTWLACVFRNTYLFAFAT